jgi:hypothetical protein
MLKQFNLTKYQGTLSVLAGLTVIISFFINTNQAISQNKKILENMESERQKELVRENEKYWVDLEKLFMNNYPYLNNLYIELYPDNKNLNKVELSGLEKFHQSNLEVHVCNILYQIIENVLHTESNLELSWKNVFKSWSKSEIFRSNWEVSKQFYDKNITVPYIDDLISQI